MAECTIIPSYDDDVTFDANIAAIDFGTTFCSLVYKVNGSDTEILKNNDAFERVPTAILIEKNENGELKVEDTTIGFFAQRQYISLPAGDHEKYLYFECFKMQLRDEENLTRGTTISAYTGADYYIIEVIAFILQHLRIMFEERLSRLRSTPMSATDFHWVLTVPAIWKNRGKQIMREAAYRAGLLCDVQPITKFTTPPTPLSEPNIPLIAKKKLVLALEPECAALYCQKLTNSMVATHCDQLGGVISDRYMILDIGGGTVDVAIHELVEDDKKINSVLQPTGNDCGGLKVNDQFSILLQNVMKDKNFEQFCSAHGKEASHKAVISELVFQNFEMYKIVFGEKSNTVSVRAISSQAKAKKERHVQRACIRIHPKFVEFYKTALLNVQPIDGVEFNDDDQIIISYSKMEEFFQPAISGILSCMTSAMASSPVPIDMIYLVGGFGGCPYVYSKVKEALDQQNIKVIVPSNYKLAVALGAVIFRQKISAISSRVSDAYYGIATQVKYDPEEHERERKKYNLEEECFDVRNYFSILLKKGQSVKFNEKFQGIYLPLTPKQTSIEFRIYRTTKDGVKFVKDIRGNPIPGIEEIGKISVPAPINGLKREERETKVEIMLGGTELHVRAVYIPTREDVNATIDFLKK